MPSKTQRITAVVSNGTPRGRRVRVPVIHPLAPTPDLSKLVGRAERRAAKGRKLSGRDAQILALALRLVRDGLADLMGSLGEREDDIEELEGPCVRCGGRGQADDGGRDEWANCPRCDGSGRVKSDA